MLKELPKTYEPGKYEDDIYKKWEESGFFNPDNLEGEPYSVMMPPPNVTGVLHLGHALENSLMDVMIRYQRMNGKKALLIPGTDHAAIATQTKVEKVLVDGGMKNPREELGRDGLLEKIKEYAEESKATILSQVRKMGTSCDWSRLAYTFDDARSQAVNEVFVKMYNDGLIYRGYRVINWTVKGQSTCSDDEIEYVDRMAKFYTFKYAKDFPITIATTRPETKLGDTAVAVNPKDERYSKYIGKEYRVDVGAEKPLEIKIIGDENVDMELGTGALGVTPAHSQIDFEMYEKQKASGNPIEIIKVIDLDGRMTKEAGEKYVGLSVVEARDKFVDWLKSEGLLEKEEEITQSVGTSDRYKDVVEALPMTQWFIDVNKKIPGKDKSLKVLMREAVTTGHQSRKAGRKRKIVINPDRFEKTYLNWIDNLRDWCISRQIWWGHRIPVWYRQKEGATKIMFMRHGQTDWNVKSIMQGQTETEINENGKKQAKEKGGIIEKFNPDFIIVSPLKRAVDTIKIATSGQREFVTDDRLKERSYGELEGMTLEQINARYPGLESFTKNSLPYLIECPGGETYEEVYSRSEEFLKDILEKYKGKKVLVLSHGDPLDMFESIINKTNWREGVGAWHDNTRIVEKDFILKGEDIKVLDGAEELYVGLEEPKGGGWVQDEDTLDTWFSSGLWTFSTLGWPKNTKDLETFHPTNWMQMGYELLFFWMARMILMSTYNLDDIPFKDVYIHGMLRDEKGNKFSKSSGNNLDPIEVSDKFGTDALRLSLIIGVTPGQDSKYFEEKIEGARNFVNKLWNVSRYILSNNELRITNYEIDKLKLSLSEEWILDELKSTIYTVNNHMLNYNFSLAAEELKSFTTDKLADWFLEMNKFEKSSESEKVLTHVLVNLLKLLHPFIPFVTELIWSKFVEDRLLLVEKYPQTNKGDMEELLKFSETKKDKIPLVKNIITEIRNARAENKVEPAKKIKAVIFPGKHGELIKSQEVLIKSLRTGIGEIEIISENKTQEDAIYVVVEGVEIYLLGAVDKEKDDIRIKKEVENLEKVISGIKNKLSNKQFIERAPEQVVGKEKERLSKFEEELNNLRNK